MFDGNKSSYPKTKKKKNNFIQVKFEQTQTIGQLRIFKRKGKPKEYELCFMLLDENDVEMDRQCCDNDRCENFLDEFDDELIKV